MSMSRRSKFSVEFKARIALDNHGHELAPATPFAQTVPQHRVENRIPNGHAPRLQVLRRLYAMDGYVFHGSG